VGIERESIRRQTKGEKTSRAMTNAADEEVARTHLGDAAFEGFCPGLQLLPKPGQLLVVPQPDGRHVLRRKRDGEWGRWTAQNKQGMGRRCVRCCVCK
jgi:hypothetical protein